MGNAPFTSVHSQLLFLSSVLYSVEYPSIWSVWFCCISTTCAPPACSLEEQCENQKRPCFCKHSSLVTKKYSYQVVLTKNLKHKPKAIVSYKLLYDTVSSISAQAGRKMDKHEEPLYLLCFRSPPFSLTNNFYSGKHYKLRFIEN